MRRHVRKRAVLDKILSLPPTVTPLTASRKINDPYSPGPAAFFLTPNTVSWQTPATVWASPKTIEVTPGDWEATGVDETWQYRDRMSLTGGIVVAGVPMHVEAYLIVAESDVNGHVIHPLWVNEYDGIQQQDSENSFRTVEIGGEAYVMVAFPFDP